MCYIMEERWKVVELGGTLVKTHDQLQTMAVAYAQICQGERPWTALGNFMNDWFGLVKDQREQLVVDPLLEPEERTQDNLRWAAFMAASVEWLCQKYGISCPEWVHHPVYMLPEPWYKGMNAYKPHVRVRLQEETPEPFTRRNIYCGNRMYNNKYEIDELLERLLDTQPSSHLN